MRARYPAWSDARQKPIDIEQRINQCRTERQHAALLAFESKELLALTAYVARQSRGEKIAVEESSLRVHVAALRRALSDGEDGARYITNIRGRGYFH